MKSKYISEEEDSHIKDEETQWAKLISSGNQYAGILLIYDQKLCAVAHEIGAAFQKDYIVSADQLAYYAKRLETRLEKIIELLSNSEEVFSSCNEFQEMKSDLEKIKNHYWESLSLFEKIPERIHSLSHRLCDELNRYVNSP